MCGKLGVNQPRIGANHIKEALTAIVLKPERCTNISLRASATTPGLLGKNGKAW